MVSGRPIIAYRAGGALETVTEDETGLFFDEQTPDSLVRTVQEFNEKKFNPEKIRKRALVFDKEKFKNKVADFLGKLK